MQKRLLVLTLALAPALGCQDDKAANLAPKPAEQAPRPSSGAASQPANPHGDAFAEDVPPGAPFSGLLKLADGLTPDDVNPTDVMFVMARESQGGGLAGRLVAVKRFGRLEFPKRYELGPSDVMVPGIPFAGPFIVTARLDRDGDPMTRGEDDLYATFPKPVKAGQEGVHLVFDRGAPKTMKAPPGVKAPGHPGPSSQPAGHP